VKNNGSWRAALARAPHPLNHPLCGNVRDSAQVEAHTAAVI